MSCPRDPRSGEETLSPFFLFTLHISFPDYHYFLSSPGPRLVPPVPSLSLSLALSLSPTNYLFGVSTPPSLSLALWMYLFLLTVFCLPFCRCVSDSLCVPTHLSVSLSLLECPLLLHLYPVSTSLFVVVSRSPPQPLFAPYLCLSCSPLCLSRSRSLSGLTHTRLHSPSFVQSLSVSPLLLPPLTPAFY